MHSNVYMLLEECVPAWMDGWMDMDGLMVGWVDGDGRVDERTGWETVAGYIYFILIFFIFCILFKMRPLTFTNNKDM